MLLLILIQILLRTQILNTNTNTFLETAFITIPVAKSVTYMEYRLYMVDIILPGLKHLSNCAKQSLNWSLRYWNAIHLELVIQVCGGCRQDDDSAGSVIRQDDDSAGSVIRQDDDSAGSVIRQDDDSAGSVIRQDDDSGCRLSD